MSKFVMDQATGRRVTRRAHLLSMMSELPQPFQIVINDMRMLWPEFGRRELLNLCYRLRRDGWRLRSINQSLTRMASEVLLAAGMNPPDYDWHLCVDRKTMGLIEYQWSKSWRDSFRVDIVTPH